MKRTFPLIASILFASAFVSGCARLGNRLEHAPLPEGAPGADTILRDLAENDAGIENFRAAAHFVLQSPEVEGVQRFTSGSYIAFRQPDQLRVVGRIRTGNIAFRLTSVGDEFLVEFPMERDPELRYYYQFEGQAFESVPFSVSPSDVARELFFPEDWAALKPREVRLLGYEGGVATLSIGPRRHPRRMLEVGQLEGGHWVVLRSERLDENGAVLAVSNRANYHEVDRYRFPTTVDVEFPGEDARISFELKNMKVNTHLVDDSTFTFNWRPPHASTPHGPQPGGNR